MGYAEPVSEIESRLLILRERIADACARAGRDPSSVALMGVSKNHPPASVAEAVRCGLRLFGENRIQEAKAKIPACTADLEWHFIGHLQSNKVRDAVDLFRVVQGVDTLDIAEALAKQAAKRDRIQPVLLEVNVSGEPSKFGWDPERLIEALPSLGGMDRLAIRGLMTIAPYAEDPELARPVFRRLRELRDRCSERLGTALPVLSMGMSGDMEVAIEEGSTLVRIGTALFGDRPVPQ